MDPTDFRWLSFYLSVSSVTPSAQVLCHFLEVSFFTSVLVICVLVLFFHPNSGCAFSELSSVFRTVICLSLLINWPPGLRRLCGILPQTHALSPGKDFSTALFIHLIPYCVTSWLLYKCFSASCSTCFLLTHFHGHRYVRLSNYVNQTSSLSHLSGFLVALGLVRLS